MAGVENRLHHPSLETIKHTAKRVGAWAGRHWKSLSLATAALAGASYSIYLETRPSNTEDYLAKPPAPAAGVNPGTGLAEKILNVISTRVEGSEPVKSPTPEPTKIPNLIIHQDNFPDPVESAGLHTSENLVTSLWVPEAPTYLDTCGNIHPGGQPELTRSLNRNLKVKVVFATFEEYGNSALPILTSAITPTVANLSQISGHFTGLQMTPIGWTIIEAQYPMNYYLDSNHDDELVLQAMDEVGPNTDPTTSILLVPAKDGKKYSPTLRFLTIGKVAQVSQAAFLMAQSGNWLALRENIHELFHTLGVEHDDDIFNGYTTYMNPNATDTLGWVGPRTPKRICGQVPSAFIPIIENQLQDVGAVKR